MGWRRQLDRWGLPAPLFWGYVAVLIFMIGDGVESNYLAPYMAGNGFTLDTAATIISFYGITVTLGSWLAGALSSLWGPRRVMLLGGVIWVVFEVLFLLVALPAESFALSFLTYGLRGIAYPMFAYAFLVWIQAATPAGQRGAATGWFWLVFTGGLPTLGSAVAIVSIAVIGEYPTFWLSLALVISGFAIGMLAVRERTGFQPLVARGDMSMGRALLGGIDILGRRPRVAVAGVVRIINTTPYFGFFIFLPGFFTEQMGFSQSGYLGLITIMGLVGMSFNPVIGNLSDRIGWRRILTFVGGLGSAVTMLLMYFVPQWSGGNYLLSLVFACLYGITLCGYVPAAALIASLCDEEDKGNALAIYCLSAGLSTFIGPVLYRLLNNVMGMDGVVWIYAALYVVSAILSWFFLVTPEDPGERSRAGASRTGTNGREEASRNRESQAAGEQA
ncbi:MFS transporter [Salinicola avicenniae]|uniref:MFS transporter n=1 Tax=Salinicola avicenniae TaxID=2916836 RepID=UPI002072F6E3|nr:MULTISPECIES: MFS transporter [unclassified Salinicola]